MRDSYLGFPVRGKSWFTMAIREFAMGGGISLRKDFDAGTLRGLAKQSRDANQTQRLLALVSIDGKAPGTMPKLTPDHRAALERIVEDEPVPAVHGVVRWRIKDLVDRLHEEFGVSVCEKTVSGALKDIGFVKLTARPSHHGQNKHALESFKKASPWNSKSSQTGWIRKRR